MTIARTMPSATSLGSTSRRHARICGSVLTASLARILVSRVRLALRNLETPPIVHPSAARTLLRKAASTSHSDGRVTETTGEPARVASKKYWRPLVGVSRTMVNGSSAGSVRWSWDRRYSTSY